MNKITILRHPNIRVLAPKSSHDERQRGCDINVQLTRNGKYVVTKFFGKRGYTVARGIIYSNTGFSIKFVYSSHSLIYGYTYEQLTFKTRVELERCIKDITEFPTNTQVVMVNEPLYRNHELMLDIVKR